MTHDGFVEFRIRVDAEQQFDILEFKIDDTKEKLRYSKNFEVYKFDLEAGTHVLTWSFIKDFSLSHGEDTAQIFVRVNFFFFCRKNLEKQRERYARREGGVKVGEGNMRRRREREREEKGGEGRGEKGERREEKGGEGRERRRVQMCLLTPFSRSKCLHSVTTHGSVSPVLEVGSPIPSKPTVSLVLSTRIRHPGHRSVCLAMMTIMRWKSLVLASFAKVSGSIPGRRAFFF